MKPLRILLGNNTLSLLAGSETWTMTLALQLKAMGHHVACFSPDLGVIANKLQEQGIQSYMDLNNGFIKPFSVVLEEDIDHNYDVIISNHWHIVEFLRAQYPKTPIISTIHGIIHIDQGQKAPEHPALNSGVNQFISVSEEIREKLLTDYNIQSDLIRNFFDIQRLSTLRPANKTPKQLMINTNYAGKGDPEIEVIREVAKHYGARVAAVGQNFTQSVDLTRAIEESDVVFGMGRSVLEGVAAGRLGIVHGRWGTGGPIIERYINDLKYFNFSGRNSGGKIATAEEIIAMIDMCYNPENLEWGKKYIAREHNVVLAAEEFVRIARDLTGQSIIRPPAGLNVAVDPAARPYKLAAS